MITLKNKLEFQQDKPYRFDMLENALHLITPVAMLGEGVWTGSAGPIRYNADALKDSVREWNHRPVLLNHPEEGYSGCSVSVINKSKLGSIQNVFYDESSNKLKGEVWFNIERCKQIAPDVLCRINKKDVLEVSTGLYGPLEQVENSDDPPTIKDIIPDHLAVLPDARGAYSVQDGGGLPRLNAYSMEDLHEALVNDDAVKQFVASEFSNTMDMFWFIEDVFEDSFVLEVTFMNDGTYTRKQYRGAYTVDGDGKLNVTGPFEHVIKETNYIKQSSKTVTGDRTMANNSEGQTNLPLDNEGKTQTPPKVELPTFNSLEDLKKYDGISKELVDSIENSFQFLNESKQKLIDSIVSNKHNVLEKEELQAFPMERLEKIANKLEETTKEEPPKKDDGEGEPEEGKADNTDYSVRGVGNQQVDNNEPVEVTPFLNNVFAKAVNK